MNDAKSFWRLYSMTQGAWAACFAMLAWYLGDAKILLLILVGQIFINASLAFVDGLKREERFGLARRFLIFTNMLVPLEAFFVMLVK